VAISGTKREVEDRGAFSTRKNHSRELSAGTGDKREVLQSRRHLKERNAEIGPADVQWGKRGSARRQKRLYR